MKIADIYVRTRCDTPALHAAKEKHQETALEAYCQINNISIRQKVYDSCSAKDFDRPGWTHYFNQLLSSSTKPDLLLFTSWDRFSRNIEQTISMRSTLLNLGIVSMPIHSHDTLYEALQVYSSKKEYLTRIIITLSTGVNNPSILYY